jgi:hypothetical protein
MRLQRCGLLQAALFMDGIDDGLALGQRARGNVDMAKPGIVLRAFVRHDLCHPARANNQNIPLH